MRNSITEVLGIKYPIIQGGMAWVADGKLAASVSEAGGLGIISGAAPVDVVKGEIEILRSITDKNFGVNIMLLAENVEEIVDLCCEQKVPVVTTGAGNPAKYMDKLKRAGVKVIPVAPSCAFAKRFETMGADAIIAEGMEAGGHIGQLTTMTLVPQVCDVVSIPVIAAGGIADGRGMRACEALGASGFQLGTIFLASDECRVHEDYKKAVVKAKDIDTVVTGRPTGHPVRGLKNKFARKMIDFEKTNPTIEEIEKFASGSLRIAVLEGDERRGSYMAGQSAGMVKEIKPVAKIIEDLMEDYNKRGNYGR